MKKTILVSFLALACMAAHADFVNGSFETDDFTGWTVTDASSGSDVLVTQNSFFNFDPTDGIYFAAFGAYGGEPDTLSQTLTTTPGQVYTLSFYLGEDGTGTEENMEITNNGSDLFNGSAPNVPDGNGGYQMVFFSMELLGTGSNTIAFSGMDVPSYIGLDDVHLTPVAAPEPASLTLLGLGVAGMVARRRATKR